MLSGGAQVTTRVDRPQLRIGLAQVNATVGELAGNRDKVVEWTMRAAEQGARIVVFPEMMLTGYPVEDLALRASFVDASISMLNDLAGRLADEGLGGIAVVTGYLGRQAGRPPSTAASFLSSTLRFPPSASMIWYPPLPSSPW